MGKIVVIGGGDIKKFRDTGRLDKETIRLTGKNHPKLLFLPTATSDSEKYLEVVKNHFGKKLGCKVDHLMLIKKKYSNKELTEKILGADMIYVGGGNTLKMMRRWRFLGVDKLLKRAFNSGVVLTGLSAGGICWFDSGHSDSMEIYGQKNWKYINVRGLGLIKGIHCPHFDSHTRGKSRRKDFIKFMSKYSQVGICIDDKCAIEFVDDKYRVISNNKNSKAYKVVRSNGKVIIEEIEMIKEFTPVSNLYER